MLINIRHEKSEIKIMFMPKKRISHYPQPFSNITHTHIQNNILVYTVYNRVNHTLIYRMYKIIILFSPFQKPLYCFVGVSMCLLYLICAHEVKWPKSSYDQIEIISDLESK